MFSRQGTPVRGHNHTQVRLLKFIYRPFSETHNLLLYPFQGANATHTSGWCSSCSFNVNQSGWSVGTGNDLLGDTERPLIHMDVFVGDYHYTACPKRPLIMYSHRAGLQIWCTFAQPPSPKDRGQETDLHPNVKEYPTKIDGFHEIIAGPQW